MQLQGEYALVTGGSSGIGLAIAAKLVGGGAHVHLVARTASTLDDARRQLEAMRSTALQQITASSCDVASESDVSALFANLRTSASLPSIVVNSAGVSLPGYFAEISVDDFDRVMGINYLGTLRILKHAVPDMVQRRRGHILNVGSVASLLGVFGLSAYCASKFAVRGLTESLRSELKPHGVWVSLLCPPDTDTPMLAAEAALKPPETAALSKSAGVLTADQVAMAAMKGLRRHTAVIVPGLEGSFTALAQRFAPGIVERIADRIIRSAQRAC